MGFGFGAWSLWLREQGFGHGFSVLSFRVSVRGAHLSFPSKNAKLPAVQGAGFRVQGSGFRVQGSGLRV